MSKDTIPRGTYPVKRESLWVTRRGFDYVVNQKYRITEGPFKGRAMVLSYVVEENNVMELGTDAEP